MIWLADARHELAILKLSLGWLRFPIPAGFHGIWRRLLKTQGKTFLTDYPNELSLGLAAQRTS